LRRQIQALPHGKLLVTSGGELKTFPSDAGKTILKQERNVATISPIHGIDCRFASGSEFATELTSLRERIANQDWRALETVWLSFAPTSDWDDGVREQDIANRVCELATTAKKLHPTT